MEPIQIKKNKVFDAVSTAASATSNSVGLDMNQSGVDGYFGAEITVTGDGTATIGIEGSSDGATWFKTSTTAAPDTALTIVAGATDAGGPDSDGKYLIQVNNIVTSKFIRFYVTETSTSNAVVVTMTLLEQ
jgi:hypothetical protein